MANGSKRRLRNKIFCGQKLPRSVDDQGNLYLSASYGKGLVLDPAGEELATINIEQNISIHHQASSA